MKNYFDVISDLHYSNKLISINPTSENLILAGDIAPLGKDISFITDLYSNVYYVYGNHEHYSPYSIASNYSYPIGNISNNFVCSLGDITIIGTTLWSYISPSNEFIQFALNDFRYIKGMTISNYNKLHFADKKFLTSALSKAKGKVLVITHHVPSFSLLRYWDKTYDVGFASACDSLIDLADIWVCGHDHTPLDIMVGSCRVVRNPIGYGFSGVITPLRIEL